MSEGRCDLGITGQDVIAEYEAQFPPNETAGVKEILDLGFGRCKLQVQAPENGPAKEAKDLIGKNVVTSFTSLTEAYFRKLEAEQDGDKAVNGDGQKKLRTNVKYVGGSVEAACALGVADGIVDLVGQYTFNPHTITNLTQTDTLPSFSQNPAKQCAPQVSRQSQR